VTGPASGWLTSGLFEVELPSGWRVRGRLPTAHDLATRGLLPDRLLEAALRGADPKWLLGEDLTAEQRQERYRRRVEYLRFLVARSIREVCQDGEWRPVEFEALVDALGNAERPPTIDDLDVDALEDVVLRIRTPQQVTDVARAIRGEQPAGEAEVAIADLEPFRGGAGRAAPDTDDAPLGNSPELLSGHLGPGGRVRSRRGTRDPRRDRGTLAPRGGEGA
jgi:hypothetical protein